MTRNGGERWRRDYDKNSDDSEDSRGSMSEIDNSFATYTSNNIIYYLYSNAINSILYCSYNNI